jgi:hypothetical protein
VDLQNPLIRVVKGVVQGVVKGVVKGVMKSSQVVINSPQLAPGSQQECKRFVDRRAFFLGGE